MRLYMRYHFAMSCINGLYLQCGPLKEVRLVKNRAGKSKGFAYIEYLSEVCICVYGRYVKSTIIIDLTTITDI